MNTDINPYFPKDSLDSRVRFGVKWTKFDSL